MGGKSTPKAPPAPDYEKLIGKQAVVNRTDSFSPFGSVTWHGPDMREQRITLSPAMQRIFNAAIGQAGGARGISAPEFDSSLDRQAMIDAAYKRSMELVDPQFAQRERSLRQNLADRGLVEGSQAYRDALSMEMGEQNRARSDAALAAVMAGDDAWNRERAYALNRDQVQGQRDQIDFNELASILGLTPQGGVAPIDVTGPAGLQYQGDLAGYQGKLMNQQNKKGFWSDILGAGATLGSAYMMSDVRLKTNIRFVEHRNGLNWYTWDWKDGSGSSFGVLAHEVKAVRPDAVGERDGYMTVNYGVIV